MACQQEVTRASILQLFLSLHSTFLNYATSIPVYTMHDLLSYSTTPHPSNKPSSFLTTSNSKMPAFFLSPSYSNTCLLLNYVPLQNTVCLLSFFLQPASLPAFFITVSHSILPGFSAVPLQFSCLLSYSTVFLTPANPMPAFFLKSILLPCACHLSYSYYNACLLSYSLLYSKMTAFFHNPSFSKLLPFLLINPATLCLPPFKLHLSSIACLLSYSMLLHIACLPSYSIQLQYVCLLSFSILL
jgi:hypothetical protein